MTFSKDVSEELLNIRIMVQGVQAEKGKKMNMIILEGIKKKVDKIMSSI